VTWVQTVRQLCWESNSPLCQAKIPAVRNKEHLFYFLIDTVSYKYKHIQFTQRLNWVEYDRTGLLSWVGCFCRIFVKALPTVSVKTKSYKFVFALLGAATLAKSLCVVRERVDAVLSHGQCDFSQGARPTLLMGKHQLPRQHKTIDMIARSNNDHRSVRRVQTQMLNGICN
jgi:hypothetical protein